MPKTRWCRELERQWLHPSLLTEEKVRSGPEHLRSGPPSRAHGAGQRRGLTLRWGSLGFLGRTRAGGVGLWGLGPPT